MPKYKDLTTIFNELKEIAVENKLSIDDVAENANIEPQLVRIFFDDSKDVIGSLSRLFDFMKIRLTSKRNIFEAYKLYDSGTQIKLTRVIEPKCSLYYDKATANFYKFSYRVKTKERSETTTEILKSEMKDIIELNVNSYKSGTYRSEIKKQ